ncbi:MAG: NAD(P)/FAD-dependent oxidoreductase [Pseudobdellovibrionaceae bacterium]
MKIAVIGAGISGLGSAYLLAQKFEVHLFESANRLGGHSHTVFASEEEKQIPIDTGFLVYNELTYPHLTAFFKHLDVVTVASDMSLSIQNKNKNLEWAGTNLNSVFGQRKNLFKPKFYLMLREVLRFAKEADQNIIDSQKNSWTLGELLKYRSYTDEFCEDYILPTGAAIWSTPEKGMLDYPAETFLNFFRNHRLLDVTNRPTWRTVKNGSIQYVQKIASKLPHIHLNKSILKVLRTNGKIEVQTLGESFVFDRVVMATHAPLTAKILDGQSSMEKKVLNSFRYEANHAFLHQDDDLMPKQKRCWASWNVSASGLAAMNQASQVSLTYFINLLQPLNTNKNYFVTLNPGETPKNVLRAIDYSHPQFDLKSIAAQKELHEIQGKSGVYFAGAWTRYGFHEDGLLSAVKVAEMLNVGVPWKI